MLTFEIKVKLNPLRSGLNWGDQAAHQVDSRARCHHNDTFLDYLNHFARKLLSKNGDDPKGPL